MIRVGVVRGGIGSLYDISLLSGANVLNVLREKHSEKYKPIDILVTKDGDWHINGRVTNPQQLMQSVDVIFNALHGEYGEDGQVQKVFESLKLPYTGSTAVPSALAMHKKMTKDKARDIGVRVIDEYMIPDYRKQHGIAPEVYFKEHAQKIFLKFSPPWVLKPVGSGASVGVSIVKTREELLDALRYTAEFSGDILVEPYIKGREASVLVTNNFRGQPVYSFLPIENGSSQQMASGRFSEGEKKELQECARNIHSHLNLRHYSASDFILTPKGAYFLEVNTLPKMTAESHILKSLDPVGSNTAEFIDHLIQLAIKRD